MTTITAIVHNGRLELVQPIDLPDGTEVEVLLPAQTAPDDGPMTADEIKRTLAAMDKIEPLEFSDEEQAALEANRKARIEWEKSHFDAHADKLQRMWE